MGKKKWIDKKTAVTFTLVHRPQNDPLIYDESAPSMVFKQVDSGNTQPRTLDNISPPHPTPSSSTSTSTSGAATTTTTTTTTTTVTPSSSSKIKTTHDLAAELGTNVTTTVRPNEGEAAQYGVYYDDSTYDYMQHLRPIGATSEAVFIEAKSSAGKGKHKVSLEDALRSGAAAGMGTGDSILPYDMLPSTSLLKTTYQNQQNIPDALAGFQPDMDPRLREVLEALEDEAYVEDDEDLFGELTGGGEVAEGDQEEFFDGEYELEEGEYGHGYGYAYGQEYEDDDGWATDDTERPLPSAKSKPTCIATTVSSSTPVSLKPVPLSTSDDDGKSNNDGETESAPNATWLAEYTKFQHVRQASKKKSTAATNDDLASSSILSFGASSEFSLRGSRKRRQRRRGARTESTGYSMTSSSLARTEGLTLLDDRFDRIEEAYADSDSDSDEHNRLPPSHPEGFVETRQDFEAIMDDFLNNYSVGGRSRRVKRGKQQTGMEQLDEIRRELGRARIK